MCFLQQANENILHCILSLAKVAKNAQADASHKAVVSPIEELEGLWIAFERRNRNAAC